MVNKEKAFDPKNFFEIESIYSLDPGDMRCEAKLIDSDKTANVVVPLEMSEDEWEEYCDSDDFDGYEFFNDNEELRKKFADKISKNFDNLIDLPKRSELSDATKIIFDEVRQSDSGMFFAETKESFLNDYNLSDKDIKKLQNDIKKYKLDDVIDFKGDEYITAYSDLETRFNNDIDISLDKSIHSYQDNLQINKIDDKNEDLTTVALKYHLPQEIHVIEDGEIQVYYLDAICDQEPGIFDKPTGIYSSPDDYDKWLDTSTTVSNGETSIEVNKDKGEELQSYDINIDSDWDSLIPTILTTQFAAGTLLYASKQVLDGIENGYLKDADLAEWQEALDSFKIPQEETDASKTLDKDINL